MSINNFCKWHIFKLELKKQWQQKYD